MCRTPVQFSIQQKRERKKTSADIKQQQQVPTGGIIKYYFYCFGSTIPSAGVWWSPWINIWEIGISAHVFAFISFSGKCLPACANEFNCFSAFERQSRWCAFNTTTNQSGKSESNRLCGCICFVLANLELNSTYIDFMVRAKCRWAHAQRAQPNAAECEFEFYYTLIHVPHEAKPSRVIVHIHLFARRVFSSHINHTSNSNP